MIVAIFDSINQIAPDQLQVSGVLTDQISFKVPFATILTGTLTSEIIRQKIVSLLDATQSQDEVKKILQIGVPFDLTAPVISPPTKDQLAIIAFNLANNLTNNINNLVFQKIVDPADPRVSQVQKDFNNAFALAQPVLSSQLNSSITELEAAITAAT